MSLFDIANGCWALRPNSFQDVLRVYDARLSGEKIDVLQVEAKLGRMLHNEQMPYEVRNGVAIVDLQGVIAPKMNMLVQISGGSSAQVFRDNLRMAVEDNTVKAVVLAIDSPGGSVQGIPEAAQAVREANAKKPVYALSDGSMCSAAYWIGSAARQVFITGEMVNTGSIGVVVRHVDRSGDEASAGVKTTEITAGKYKRIASEFEPLTKEGRAYLQDSADYIYSVFVEAVAQQRKVPVKQVLSNMADGRVFIGSQGIKAGLVDGITSLDELIQTLSRTPDRPPMAGASVRQAAGSLSKEEKVAQAKRYMAEHGTDFMAAMKQLGFAN